MQLIQLKLVSKMNNDNEQYLTAQEISSRFGLSIRTTNNRLTVLRKNDPTCYKEVLTNTKHKQYLYKASAITKENVGTRHYIKREKKIPEVGLPPIYIVNPKSGLRYNIFALRALLRVLESTTLFERFIALDSVIFVFVLIYLFVR